MNNTGFTEQYHDIVERAQYCLEKARREGLLALDEELDHEKIDERDIFEYGLRFVIDGISREFVDMILSNIIDQEKDEQSKKLKTIQKEAVLIIQRGLNPSILLAALNSLTGLSLKEDTRLKDYYAN